MRLEPSLRAEDVADEVRELFRELERMHGAACREVAAEYVPALDVYETADTFEIRIDLPGVSATSVRLMLKRDILIVAGEKWPGREELASGAVFQQVERSFGRFARGIRLGFAIDGGRAQAKLRNGQLAISVPKIEERRGRHLPITIE
jgi:HSP20 family protein